MVLELSLYSSDGMILPLNWNTLKKYIPTTKSGAFSKSFRFDMLLGVGLVSLVVVLSPIILFLYMIDSTLHQRNKVAVDYITTVFNRNKKPILVLYGKSHINEIKDLLDKNAIDSVIMK